MEKKCNKHGVHSDWRYKESRQEYLCRFCIREKNSTKRKIRNELPVSIEPGESSKLIDDSPESVFNGRKYRYRQVIWRIELLNSICGYKHGNIGWSCGYCGEFDNHQSFFDIDHIVAKCNGGEDTIENYQVLCPNCHKRKTLNVDRKVISVKS